MKRCANLFASKTGIITAAILAVLTTCGEVRSAGPEIPDNKKLGTIYNNDINCILGSLPGGKATPGGYKAVVLDLLDAGPGVLAQNVGMPDPVIYRSKVATLWSKHFEEVVRALAPTTSDVPESQIKEAWAIDALVAAGTDPLAITIEACRERGVPIVASYRMNAEDFYGKELDLYDFGRQNKNLRIPARNCLDPAHLEVYNHRMAIFTEVANNYDVDGIEFDFKRWYHMISDPHENHPVLTRMVAETRKMLDEVAKRKGRKRLLLGVRVEPMVAGTFSKEDFPGAIGGPPTNRSCLDAGLDVKTWIEKGYVDYVCPSFFWPRLPGIPKTAQFAELAKGTDVGIYPSIFGLPVWSSDRLQPGQTAMKVGAEATRRHRDEIIHAALKMYEDGADGISTFNFFVQDYPPPGQNRRAWDKKESWASDLYGRGSKEYGWVLRCLLPKLSSAETLRKYLAQPAVVPCAE